MFDVTDHPENQRSAILLDLYFNALAYANKEDMTMEKTSCITRYPPGCSRKSQG